MSILAFLTISDIWAFLHLNIFIQPKPPPLIIINFGFPVYTDLWKTGLFERMSMQTDEDEHSIEMHLPYTAKAMER